jgi:Tfp pilus assembly protein PilV
MNTSTKITTNRISYTKSFIVLSICVLSSIILCLYAIFHNRTSRKENKKSDQEQDLSTTSDSNVSISSDKSFWLKRKKIFNIEKSIIDKTFDFSQDMIKLADKIVLLTNRQSNFNWFSKKTKPISPKAKSTYNPKISIQSDKIPIILSLQSY